MSELIDCRDIHKTYGMASGAVHALRGIALSIASGEFVAIVGRSGSGKSTLLQIIGLLDRPSSGSYFWNGIDVAGLHDDALSALRGGSIGFVFQQFHLLPSLTLLENVALPLVYLGVNARERRAAALEALHIVKMEHRQHHMPHEISGGEKQRAAMARAIVHKPLMLLADEPTGNLDSRVKGDIMDYLIMMNKELGVTLVIVTHDEATAAHARRVVTLADGMIVEGA